MLCVAVAVLIDAFTGSHAALLHHITREARERARALRADNLVNGLTISSNDGRDAFCSAQQLVAKGNRLRHLFAGFFWSVSSGERLRFLMISNSSA